MTLHIIKDSLSTLSGRRIARIKGSHCDVSLRVLGRDLSKPETRTISISEAIYDFSSCRSQRASHSQFNKMTSSYELLKFVNILLGTGYLIRSNI